MVPWVCIRFRRTTGIFGLALSALALVVHLAFGSVVVDGATEAVAQSESDALAIICGDGSTDGRHDPAPLPRHAADGILAVLSLTAAQHGLTFGSGPWLPVPAALAAVRLVAMARVCSRLSCAPEAAYPRGPPALV